VSPNCYADLTPALVLDLLAAAGLVGDGRVLQLNSFENRVYQVFLEDGSAVVAKFYRPGRWSDEQILEEHRFSLELAAEEIAVVPPLALDATQPELIALAGTPATLASWRRGRHRFSAAPRCGGREPDLEVMPTLERLGRFIGRLHAVGARHGFDFRRRIDPARDGDHAVRTVLGSGQLPPSERERWQQSATAAVDRAAKAFDAVPGLRMLRLHGDCHLGNVLWRDDSPHLVDLDDACCGPAVQDLWMLVSGDAATMAQQFDAILAGYGAFADFDRRELALVEPLRTLRMVRHSAWIAERWSDPAFPAAFPFFGSGAYWSQQVTQLREQLVAMA
jgi:Ser/Thr protein kinase RdoA (MazF antagonist)